jgi:tRNA acetyltransferase TAN1
MPVRSGSRSDSIKDGTAIWEKRSIDGPGIWVSCETSSRIVSEASPEFETSGVKGKEKQTVGELYDLFESVRILPAAETICH